MKTAFRKHTLTTMVASFVLALAVVWSVVPAAAATTAPTANTTATPAELECPICDFDMASYTGVLSADEVHALLLALNDEYHAWAVYEQVMQDFGTVQPFSNIQRAEESHINALKRQFNLYDVPIPDNPWVGNVASFGSVAEACAGGVDAEIANIALYDTLFSSTERQSILNVYRALQRGSVSHQQAFERCTEGVTCPMEPAGRQGSGNGNGNGSGNGNGNGRGR
jgi:hypothetical protein